MGLGSKEYGSQTYILSWYSITYDSETNMVCITKITELNSPINDDFLRTRLQIKWLITFETATNAIYHNILFGSITAKIPWTLVWMAPLMPPLETVSADFVGGSVILNMSKLIKLKD
ncbi:hypothetical protein D3C72_1406000 [compost metagenome]